MRLIDADALERDMQNEWEQNEISNGDWIRFREILNDVPTIDHAYGFPLEHLAFIATVMEKEGVTPGEIAELLRDVGKISEMIVDVMQTIREAVRRIDDDPSHPFADGVMMKE